MKNTIGDHGFTAAKDAVSAYSSVKSAVTSYKCGNDRHAWESLRKAGYSTLGCVTNGVEQFAKDAVNTAVDGVAGAGLAAIQAVPGANIAVDGGIAVYEGYKISTHMSGIAGDIQQGRWEDAGDALVGLGSDLNANAGAVVNGIVEDVADAVVSNTFQMFKWPSSQSTRSGHSTQEHNHHNNPNHHTHRRSLFAAEAPSWAPRNITFSSTDPKFNVMATRASLMAFYESTGGHATELQWDPSDSYCNWEGVTCNSDTGAVTQVDVSHAGLSGLQMEDVCALVDLEALIVEGNNITTVPACLGAHKKLRYINVASNRISGGFPEFLLGIPTIRTIDVRNNVMGGTMPNAKVFAQATHLRALLTADNAFTGPLDFLIHNHELHMVDVRNNQHSGELGRMRFCAHMPLIMHVFVSGNSGVGGVLPREFSNCPYLMTLHLADTNVRGTVPVGLGKLPHLREVNASNSKLEGDLPAGGVLSGRDSDRGAHFEGTAVASKSCLWFKHIKM